MAGEGKRELRPLRLVWLPLEDVLQLISKVLLVEGRERMEAMTGYPARRSNEFDLFPGVVAEFVRTRAFEVKHGHPLEMGNVARDIRVPHVGPLRRHGSRWPMTRPF